MLRPINAAQAADVAVIDIVNRGGITHFVFNLGRNVRAGPESAEFYGDALLMNAVSPSSRSPGNGMSWPAPPRSTFRHLQSDQPSIQSPGSFAATSPLMRRRRRFRSDIVSPAAH
jgi:hypothetical protein